MEVEKSATKFFITYQLNNDYVFGKQEVDKQ